MTDHNTKPTPITMYTSSSCPQSWATEQFMNDYEIPVNLINIDQVPGAREKLIEINGGYASVPTLLFADGTRLTEPSFRQLREKLNIEESSGVLDKILGLFR
jgi:mycoredoxin